jgi:hypothetical protein
VEIFRSRWLEICKELGVQSEELSLDISAVHFSGRGFFPGADGRWELGADPTGLEVLVLGQDFGTLDYLGTSLLEQDEHCQTWRVLMKFLDETNTPKEKCFFSNCYIGYRKHSTMTGALAISDSSKFHLACKSFLEFQVSQIKPKLILTLGRDALAFVSHLSRGARIARTKSWQKIENRLSPDRCLQIEVGERTYNVFPIIHPSIRASNLRHRYPDERGREETGFRSLIAQNVL